MIACTYIIVCMYSPCEHHFWRSSESFKFDSTVSVHAIFSSDLNLNKLYPVSDCALYRVAKTHGIPYLYRSFSAKVTYI